MISVSNCLLVTSSTSNLLPWHVDIKTNIKKNTRFTMDCWSIFNPKFLGFILGSRKRIYITDSWLFFWTEKKIMDNFLWKLLFFSFGQHLRDKLSNKQTDWLSGRLNFLPKLWVNVSCCFENSGEFFGSGPKFQITLCFSKV